MNKFKKIWNDLLTSFWFIPSVFVLINIVLATLLIELDSLSRDEWLDQWPRLFGAGAEGARQMLATLAGSMMSVMGITFSMTLVALALASSQYTSRILRSFMGSRVTQVTLGIFAGIFAYCLVVLRTIRGGAGGGENEFVPSLAVFFAFLLALGGVVVLVFFIHHIASSIQASSIIASIAKDTISSIERVFPNESEYDINDEITKDKKSNFLDKKIWKEIKSNNSGYIQSVGKDSLLRLAKKQKIIIRMDRGIGDFVVKQTTLASIVCGELPTHKIIEEINSAFSIGRHRTVEQDPTFGIRQIVDMALRALSPGVNDTSTAIMCVDYLTAILAHLACRKFPSPHYYDGNELRFISLIPSFEGLLAEAFDQIRESTEGNRGIISRMLSAFEILAELTTNIDRRSSLHEQVLWIAELAGRTTEGTHSRERIAKRLMEVRESLKVKTKIRKEK